MKELSIIVVFCCSFFGFSQEATVQKSVFNAQAGLFGVFLNNEIKLTPDIVLKTEIGLEPFYLKSSFREIDEFGMIPTINIEPRWYYNLDRRISNEKDINNNAGNFISLRFIYQTEKPIFNNNVTLTESIALTPVYGFKRNFSKDSSFNYEFNFGIGVQKEFLKQYGYNENEISAYLHVRLAIGLNFLTK